MNNEPVAFVTSVNKFDPVMASTVLKVGTPLYTHPVKEQDESFDRTASHMAGEYVSYTKELTDEEIEEVEKLCKKPLASWAWQVEFARAILRKAQGDV